MFLLDDSKFERKIYFFPFCKQTYVVLILLVFTLFIRNIPVVGAFI